MKLQGVWLLPQDADNATTGPEEDKQNAQ